MKVLSFNLDFASSTQYSAVELKKFFLDTEESSFDWHYNYVQNYWGYGDDVSSNPENWIDNSEIVFIDTQSHIMWLSDECKVGTSTNDIRPVLTQ